MVNISESKLIDFTAKELKGICVMRHACGHEYCGCVVLKGNKAYATDSTVAIRRNLKFYLPHNVLLPNNMLSRMETKIANSSDSIKAIFSDSGAMTFVFADGEGINSPRFNPTRHIDGDTISVRIADAKVDLIGSGHIIVSQHRVVQISKSLGLSPTQGIKFSSNEDGDAMYFKTANGDGFISDICSKYMLRL